MSRSPRSILAVNAARLSLFLALGGATLIVTPATPSKTAAPRHARPAPAVSITRHRTTWDGVTVSPVGRLVPLDTITVQVTFCQQIGDPFLTTPHFDLNNVDVTGNFYMIANGNQMDNCDTWTRWEGLLTMSPVPEHWSFNAVDNAGYFGGDLYAVPALEHGVAVTSDAVFISPTASSTGNVASFTVQSQAAFDGWYHLAKLCSGAAASSCAVSADSIYITQGGTGSASVTYTASGTPGDTAQIALIAIDSSDTPVVSGGAFSEVTVKAAPSPGVVLARSLGTYPRSSCVTAAISADVAAECGALRIVHPLPGVSTLDKGVSPALAYSSFSARPIPVIQADITIPCSLPDTVRVVVDDNGTARGSGTWLGSDWGTCGNTRRVALAVDVDAVTPLLEDYYLQVTYVGGAGTYVTSPTEKIAHADRSASWLGAGWWLTGLEKLQAIDANTLFWVGGDGSTKLYAGGGSTFIAEAYDRPDTITYNGGTGEWTRHGPSGLSVLFNSSGCETSATNRLGQVTRFTYVGGTQQIDSLIVPVLSGTPLAYKFYYSSNILDSIVAPNAGTARKVAISRTGNKVTSIADPDGSSVSFGYGSGSNSNRIESRTDRRGVTTSFAYDGSGGLTRSALDMGGSDSLVTTFRPAETEGVGDHAMPLDSVYTRIDGPRSDAVDVTKIWIGRFGAPERIRNADGSESQLIYDGTWPGLVGQSRSPFLLLSRAFYASGTGLMDSSTVYNPLSTGSNATTKYTWDTKWRTPTSVTNPIGTLDSTSYDASTGNRVWTQTGGSSHRFTFTYTAAGLDSAVTTPTSDVTIMTHNALGNVESVISPKGYISFHYQNAIGQDTLSASPAGDTTNATSFNASYYTRVKTWYDIAGQDTASTTYGPAVVIPSPYSTTLPADTLRITKLYNAEGGVIRTRRIFTSNGSPVTLRDSTAFDNAGRVTKQFSPVSEKNFFLDRAGNATQTLDANGNVLTMSYDAMNRLVRRITPSVNFDTTTCYATGAFGGAACYYHFPTIGNDFCFDADTAKFAYGPGGLIVRANNRYARVSRFYYATGALQQETSIVRAYNEPGDTPCITADSGAYSGGAEWRHDYTFTHTYDLAGNQTTLTYPVAATACAHSPCQSDYVIDATTGLVSRVRDDLGDSVRFSYDASNRLRSTRYSNGWRDTVDLDAAGQVVLHMVDSSGGYLAINDSVAFDAAGRTRRGVLGQRDGTPNAHPSMETWYGPLGAVAASSGVTTEQGGQTTELFLVDAIGNRTRREAKNQRAWPHPDVDGIRISTYNSAGQMEVDSAPVTMTYYSSRHMYYDGVGNETMRALKELDYQSATNLWDATMSYYDAANKLRVVSRAVGPMADDETHPGQHNVFEEYFYDALGRRVITRSRHPYSCSAFQNSECSSYVQRTAWDGDQIGAEFRTPGATGTPIVWLETDGAAGATNDAFAFGRVSYIHAGGMDKPLAVLRMGISGVTDPVVVFPYSNWRGQFEVGSRQNGAKCTRISTCTYNIAWVGSATTLDGAVPEGAADSSAAWFGSLLAGSADGSGFVYQRNRFYDPATGRFTQEDPIGLGGGMNAYGFAGGDRVNFSDPMGLDPTWLLALAGGGSLEGAAALGGMTLGGPPAWIAIGGLALASGLDHVLGGGTNTGSVSRTAAADATAVWTARSNDLPARGKPNSSGARDDGKGNGQIRDYGPNGKAKTDYDFGHDHDGNGDPHAHDWDWSKTPPRQPSRPTGPGEKPPGR